MISVSIQTDQLISLVIPAGRLDSTSSHEFEQALQPLIERENDLIIDLSQCPYLSSAGIRTLLKTEKILKSKGGGLLLCGLSSEVFQILEMAGMVQIFRIFGNTDEALSEHGRLRLLASGSQKWLSGAISFEFLPFENKREAAFLWKNQEIAGYNELGFSIGIGSPADKPEEDKQVQGIFISNGHSAGFIPENVAIPPDFRIPQNHAAAGIFVSLALSFGTQPIGLARITEPASIPLGRLADELYPIKQQFTSGETDMMTLVVANFDGDNPSVSIFLVADQELSEVLKPSGFPEIQNIELTGARNIGLWGARFVLGDIPDNFADPSLTRLLEKVLTIENIVDVEPIHYGDELINPVTWIFISKGLGDCISMRLLIETEDDLQLPPHKAFLARRLYTDSARLVIKQIHGGYSAQTFQVTSFDHAGRKLRPTVLKIADRAMILRESDRCKLYANPYIFNNSAMVLGTEFFGDTGALRYNFVGIGGEQTRLKWLTHYFQNWQTEQLEPLFDKIFLQILHPWYGQPIAEPIYPFKDHDPTFTFFPGLCLTASEELSVSSDEQYFTVEETSQRLINPYWFLKHEFAQRRETAIDYYTSICHGDLNMQNILLDEDMNVYLIDFSETRPRSLVSDFARLEAIFMIEHAPLANEEEREEYFRFISQFYDSVSLNEPPVNSYRGEHRDKVNRNVSLTLKMREFAAKGVKGHPNPVPYCLALLEWMLPIVCYSSTSTDHKRLSMIVSGLLCKNVMDNL